MNLQLYRVYLSSLVHTLRKEKLINNVFLFLRAKPSNQQPKKLVSRIEWKFGI